MRIVVPALAIASVLAPLPALAGEGDAARIAGELNDPARQEQMAAAMEAMMGALLEMPAAPLINAAKTLRKYCVEGITANEKVLQHYMNYSIGTVTALNPVIGYDKATELAAEALKKDTGIVPLVREKKILTEEQINEILNPAALTGQGR